MKMNMDALKALELKLAEYTKANGAVAEHESANNNCHSSCANNCSSHCKGECDNTCYGKCAYSVNSK